MNKRNGPVRIMDLRGTYKGGGGPDKTILLSAAMHDRERVDVLVTYLRDPSDKQFEISERAKRLNINYIDVPDRRLVDFTCIRQLNRILNEYDHEIIHAHDDKSSLYSLFLKALNPRVKVMYTCHLYSKYRRVDFKSLVHYLEFQVRKSTRLFCIRRSNKPILAVSEAVRRVLINEGISPRDIITIQNGIDTKIWHRDKGTPILKKELGIPDEAILIGTVARIAFQKDLPTFYKVANMVREKYPQSWFVIVGDGEGDELERAKRQALDSGVENFVFFTGHRNDLLDIYASFDLFLMTSVSEGLPNTVLEAMAMQVPVISTAVDGVPELVLHGETGYLSEMKDVRGLADSIGKLIHDKELRYKFAKAAELRVMNHFSFQNRVVKMEELYRTFAWKPR